MKILSALGTQIGQRFLAIFLAISLVPLVAMGWFSIKTSERALQQQTEAVLRSSADAAEAQLREFLGHLKQGLLGLARDEDLLRELPNYGADTAPEGRSASPTLAERLARQQRRLPDLQEVFVLSPDGRVVASSTRRNTGKDLKSADYFERGKESFYAGEIARDPESGETTWVMTAPIGDDPGHEALGVLAFRIDPRTLSELTSGRRVLAQGADSQSFRLGDTGETYIVNRQRLMITESRFMSNAVLRVKVDTLPVRVAQERGQEIAAIYTDYRGIRVSGASMILREPGWVVLSEMDFSQAFVPLQHVRNRLLEAALGLALVVCFLAWHSTRRIIRPLKLLSESDRALAIGDESTAIVSEEGLPNDEIGQLVRRRNSRIKALFAHQRKLEERTAKLKETVAELEHMSYSIMHDMRAPLRAITGFTKMVLESDGHRLSPDGVEYLQRVTAATKRMDHLICDVLNYSLVVRGELPLRPVNVSELLHGIVQTYPAFESAHVEIRIPADLPPVQGNEAALTQCFSNLLENAVKFVEPGRRPHVEVTGEKVDGWVRISVDDNGIGIPQAFQGKIFGMFQRGTTDYEGTGMGLAIVRKAADRMGGRVGLISQPHHGSRFWIDLRATVVQTVQTQC